jgi:glycosyltransferase involved in cell wall biosynthesis
MNSEIQSGLVSTIIPVFNRPKMVVEAIQSVLAQDYRPIEIIVVDDGSTDDTANVLAEMERDHSEIIFLQQQNKGPGAARELGRQRAAGEYIQYLDSDDLLLASKFSRQVSALLKHAECGAAYGKTQAIIDGEIQNNLPWKRTWEKNDTMFPSFLNQRWWDTSTPIYRRKLLDMVGPWCELMNEEDWEYDCRVASLGTKLAYVDEFVSLCRRHDDHLSQGGSSNPAKLRSRCDARWKIYRSAENSSIPIPDEEMELFSTAAFLIARQCSAVNIVDCAKRMLELSIKATNGKAIKQRVFWLTGKTIGWQRAAKLVTAFGR